MHIYLHASYLALFSIIAMFCYCLAHHQHTTQQGEPLIRSLITAEFWEAEFEDVDWRDTKQRVDIWAKHD